MKALVTGSAGFVGKNLVPYLINRGIEVVTLDKDPQPTICTYKHIQYSLGSFDLDLHHELGDIDVVINLAAQSHVDRSITGPKAFIDDNVNGALELFEACRKRNVNKIIHFSTDEVGACLDKGEFVEEFKFDTGSTYSASKAAQELLALAYIKTFDLPIVITRCVNIFGKEQADEKFIPTVCRNAVKNTPVPVYGNGLQMRQWVSVDHVCDFVNFVCTATFIPPKSVLHITGTREMYNIMLASTILNMLDRPQSLIEHVGDRLGHDVRYALGRTEDTNRYGCPEYDENLFMKELQETVAWYRRKYESR